MNCFKRILVCCDGILGLILLMLLDYSEGLTCVRCESRTESTPGECQHDPPAPVPCPRLSTADKYCIVARELDKEGKLMNFVRDCTTVNTNNCTFSGMQPPHPFKVCYNACRENGCNNARSLHSQLSWATGLSTMATVLVSYQSTWSLWCSLSTF